jgi:hypothetical protein
VRLSAINSRNEADCQWTLSYQQLGHPPIHHESDSGHRECKLEYAARARKLTNRAVVMTVSMIPMFVLWWNVEGILLKLGQGTSPYARKA